MARFAHRIDSITALPHKEEAHWRIYTDWGTWDFCFSLVAKSIFSSVPDGRLNDPTPVLSG